MGSKNLKAIVIKGQKPKKVLRSSENGHEAIKRYIRLYPNIHITRSSWISMSR